MRFPINRRPLALAITTALLALIVWPVAIASGGLPGVSAASVAAAEGVPTCTASELSAIAQVGRTSYGSGEFLGGEIVYTNTSTHACTLQWIPTVQVLDANGAPLTVAEHDASSVPQSAVPAVTLQPGQKALNFVAWHNFCPQPLPPGPYSLSITLPNDGTLSVPFSTAGGFSAVPPSPCTWFPAPAYPSTLDVEPFLPQPPSVPHDSRYFPQTGYRIDNDTIWNYFTHRGGVATFGYPTSRTFEFEGFTTQFFQRRIVQIGPNGQARLLNLLDAGLLPYTRFNNATFPGNDASLVSSAPPPTLAGAVLAFVAAHAPNTFEGLSVNFDQTFLNTVSYSTAFPNGGGDASLLPGFDLEMWGIPTSQPMVDPNNHNFVYLRWQRGIMMYDASCHCTQGVLLGDYLKDIITGDHLPPDLAQEAQNSPLYRQLATGAPNWVRDPSALPNTDLTDAFNQE